MAIVSLTANTWTTIVTTDIETVVQNRGSVAINVATEDTTSLGRDGGLELLPGDAVVFGAGVTVKGYSIGKAGVATAIELKA